VLVLLVASVLSALLGNLVDSILVGAIVALSIALNFLQAFRSARAVDELRSLVAPTANVLHEETWMEVQRRQVVSGDIVKHSAGDLLPADARLVTSWHLHAQQAALTATSPGRGVDCAPSALPHSLHAHLRQLAQSGGTLVRIDHPAGDSRRLLPQRARAYAQIDSFVTHYNASSGPFIWTATADSIFNKLYRLTKVINGTRH
jgi:E1-E2 ATPase